MMLMLLCLLLFYQDCVHKQSQSISRGCWISIFFDVQHKHPLDRKLVDTWLRQLAEAYWWESSESSGGYLMTWDSLHFVFVFVLSWDSHLEILLTKMCNLGGGNSNLYLCSPLPIGNPKHQKKVRRSRVPGKLVRLMRLTLDIGLMGRVPKLQLF